MKKDLKWCFIDSCPETWSHRHFAKYWFVHAGREGSPLNKRKERKNILSRKEKKTELMDEDWSKGSHFTIPTPTQACAVVADSEGGLPMLLPSALWLCPEENEGKTVKPKHNHHVITCTSCNNNKNHLLVWFLFFIFGHCHFSSDHYPCSALTGILSTHPLHNMKGFLFFLHY